MPRDTAPQTARPVTTEDPAWFFCGGQASPDYGKVFASKSAGDQFTRYDFDRAGDSFARLCPAPEGDWLEVQGRLFRIVGEAS